MCMLRKRKVSLIPLVIILMLSFLVHGDEDAQPLNIVELHRGEKVQLLSSAQLLEDANGELTWSQALHSNSWTPIDTNDTNDLNLGITNSTYWFRVSLRYADVQMRVFQIHYPLLDYVDFYLLQDDQLIKHVATGDALPFDSREVEDKDFVFSHFQNDNQVLTLLIKAQTQGTMVLPLSSVDIEYYAQEESVENIAYGIYFGITIAMMLYNFMLFVYLREQTYLYYCLFVFVIFISAISYTGHGFYWLWPNNSELNAFMAPFTAAMGFLVSTLFMSSFLQIRHRGKWGVRVFNIGITLSLMVIFSTMIVGYSASIKIISLVQILLTIVFVSYSISLWRKGVLEAKYFTLAWLSFIIGNVVSAMRVVGMLPSNDFTIYASLYGNVIEMLMLSMGLAYRFETMRKTQIALSRELRHAQQDAIHNLEKYRHLFQQSPVGLFRYDREADNYDSNQKTTQLMNKYRDIREFLRGNLDFSDYKNLLKSNEIKDKVINLGSEKYYNLSLLTVKDNAGRVVEIEGSLFDISVQKQAEGLRIANEKEKLNALTQLVVGISHQLNTPLGVVITTEDLIKNNLKMILDDVDNNKLKKDDLLATLSMTQDAMALSSENIKIMSSILNDLRASIRSREQLNLSDIDSTLFFTNLLGYFKSQLKEEGRECAFELLLETNQIKSFYSDYEVVMDVFLRLLTNSYYHAYSIGETVQNITVILTQDNDFFNIEYRDDGRGLDDTERKNMFIPFFTGQTRKKDNSGLGMYILHNQVVKILNGRVDLLASTSGFAIKIQLPKEYFEYEDC